MSSCIQISRCLTAVTLACGLAGCGNSAGPGAASTPVPVAESGAAPVVANNCRSPNAQSAQRGCRPAVRVMGSL